MAVKGIKLNFGPQQVVVSAPAYTQGWYWDPNTGQLVYYDATTRAFYAMSAGGVLTPMAQNWHSAPYTVTLAPGDKLQMTLTFQYTGPAVSGVNAHYSINKSAIVGGEAMSKDQAFNIPANLTTTPVEVTNSYTFTIPTTVEANWTDIYVVISGGTPAITGQEYGFSNALVIISNAPSISGFAIKSFAKV
jgi:hypothetical protein